MPDGDQTRNDLTKALDSAKYTLNDKKSVIKAFADAEAELDAKVKAVNNSVSAKACAGVQVAAYASFKVGGGYRVPARRSGNGYRAPFYNRGGDYHASSVGGNTELTREGIRAVTVAAAVIVALLELAQPMVQIEKLIGNVII